MSKPTERISNPVRIGYPIQRLLYLSRFVNYHRYLEAIRNWEFEAFYASGVRNTEQFVHSFFPNTCGVPYIKDGAWGRYKAELLLEEYLRIDGGKFFQTDVVK